MDENKVVTEPEGTPEKTDNAEPTAGEAKEEAKTETFTQEHVNDIVRSRLDKAQQRLFTRYGVENRDELDALIGKSQSYDAIKEKFDGLQSRNAELEQELAFTKNNINPDRKDDILAHFKGKGIDFSNDNLVNELPTHPEWLNPVKTEDKPKTTIEALGSDSTFEKPKVDERDEVAKLFGLSRFVEK